MENTRSAFRARAVQALGDATLRQALDQAREGFVAKRAARFAELPELEGLRDAAAALKDRVLDRLDEHLERYEAAVVAAGGQVHRARDAAEARAIVLAICKAAGARRITKGKSMVSEEIGLNDALVAAGLDLVETDLGEYIIQLAGETPRTSSRQRCTRPASRSPISSRAAWWSPQEHDRRAGGRGAACAA